MLDTIEYVLGYDTFHYVLSQVSLCLCHSWKKAPVNLSKTPGRILKSVG